MTGKLFYGDNLEVLRGRDADGKPLIAEESVDLIYLDPPLNSAATYNVLFRAPDGKASEASLEAFEDTWHWGDAAARAYEEVLTQVTHTDAATMLRGIVTALGKNDMTAYLSMMAVRLIELHRVLKPTGSLYLHCDPTASHYLKVVLDGIFGAENFRNEIVWKRGHAHNSAKRYGPSRGIDGIRWVRTGPREGDLDRIIVSVKGGENVSVRDVRDLAGTVQREGALGGVLITLAAPTREMLREAASHGYASTGLGQFRKIMVKTVEELLRGVHDDAERLPPLGRSEGFRRAPRERRRGAGDAEQAALEL